MSVELAIPDPGDLTSWGDRKLDNAIRKGHASAGAHRAAYEEHATLTGLLLIERKRRVKHGEWLPWLDENFDGSSTTADTYRKMAEEWLSNSQPTGNLNSVSSGTPEPVAEADWEPSNAADVEIVDDVEIVPEPQGLSPSDPPAMYLPDVVSESASTNLRTQAVQWFEQGRRVRTLLDSGETALPKSEVDRAALERDVDVMVGIANRLKEAIRRV